MCNISSRHFACVKLLLSIDAKFLVAEPICHLIKWFSIRCSLTRSNFMRAPKTHSLIFFLIFRCRNNENNISFNLCKKIVIENSIQMSVVDRQPKSNERNANNKCQQFHSVLFSVRLLTRFVV